MKTWDRGYIHGAIAEATGVLLHADDPLPDTLIAKAQELGIEQADLRKWIYDELGPTLTHIRLAAIAAALESWAQRCLNPAQAADPDRSSTGSTCHRISNPCEHARCQHCGEVVNDPGNHECNGRGKEHQP